MTITFEGALWMWEAEKQECLAWEAFYRAYFRKGLRS